MRSKSIARVRSTLVIILAAIFFMGCAVVMTYAAGTSSDKVTVTLSAGDSDQYYVVSENVEATGDLAETYFPAIAGYEPEGVSWFDVLVAYHISKYGKANVTAKLGLEDYSYAAITKAFGVDSSAVMTITNGAYTNAANEAVKDGDKLYLGFYKDTSGWSDFYGAFVKDEYTAKAGEALDLAVTANSYGSEVVPSAVTVCTLDQETGAKTELATTYKDGIATVTFETAGIYYVVPSGESTYSSWSGEVTGVISGDVSMVTVTAEEDISPAPLMVTGLESVRVKGKTMKIKFDKLDGAKDYMVEYKAAGKKKWTSAMTKGKTTYTIKNLKSSSMIEVRVSAVVVDANGAVVKTDYSKVARMYVKAVKGSAKAIKKGFTVKLTKDKKAASYDLQYSLKKDFSNAKKKTLKKSKTKLTVKKLKSGKTYYVRWRPVAKKSGKKYYGVWKTAKVKVK